MDNRDNAAVSGKHIQTRVELYDGKTIENHTAAAHMRRRKTKREESFANLRYF
jgi:hypothetical protein